MATAATASSVTKETHRCFSVSFKLHAVEIAEKNSKSNAARQFNVDVRRVREWCKQKDKLIEKKRCGQSEKKRLDGRLCMMIWKKFYLNG